MTSSRLIETSIVGGLARLAPHYRIPNDSVEVVVANSDSAFAGETHADPPTP